MANHANSSQSFFLASSSSRPPGRLPVQLLEEPRGMNALSGLAGPARDSAWRWRKDDSDWPVVFVGALVLVSFGTRGGTDIPEAAAATAEPV